MNWGVRDAFWYSFLFKASNCLTLDCSTYEYTPLAGAVFSPNPLRFRCKSLTFELLVRANWWRQRAVGKPCADGWLYQLGYFIGRIWLNIRPWFQYLTLCSTFMLLHSFSVSIIISRRTRRVSFSRAGMLCIDSISDIAIAESCFPPCESKISSCNTTTLDCNCVSGYYKEYEAGGCVPGKFNTLQIVAKVFELICWYRLYIWTQDVGVTNQLIQLVCCPMYLVCQISTEFGSGLWFPCLLSQAECMNLWKLKWKLI